MYKFSVCVCIFVRDLKLHYYSGCYDNKTACNNTAFNKSSCVCLFSKYIRGERKFYLISLIFRNLFIYLFQLIADRLG